MNYRFVLAAATLALAACGSSKPDATASEAPKAADAAPAASAPAASTAPAAAAAGPVATPAKGAKPPREFVVGKWGTDGDCALAIDLKADGTSDGPFGKWTYSDGTIGFADAPEMKINVTVLDDKTMESHNDDGKTKKMTRCP